jgi:hypothetical protein
MTRGFDAVVHPTNASGACTPSNNVYYVANLEDSNQCVADTALGDLVGTNTVTVNPRPTSTQISLDEAYCNDGTPYTITNILTGIGPWVISWSDGTKQTNSSAGCPVTNTYMVHPTNASGACTPSNNVYYVANLVDSNECVADNALGDIIGTNTVTVNPRPTSTQISLDKPNCNDGTPYTITNILTGIGPWVISWSDGTKQTNSSAGCPVTNTYTVHPTNASGAWRKGTLIPNQAAAPLELRNVRILWATWHLASAFGFGFAAILLILGNRESAPDPVTAWTLILSFAVGSFLVLVATRGRHPGWIGLLIVSVLTYLGGAA